MIFFAWFQVVHVLNHVYIHNMMFLGRQLHISMKLVQKCFFFLYFSFKKQEIKVSKIQISIFLYRFWFVFFRFMNVLWVLTFQVVRHLFEIQQKLRYSFKKLENPKSVLGEFQIIDSIVLCGDTSNVGKTAETIAN